MRRFVGGQNRAFANPGSMVYPAAGVRRMQPTVGRQKVDFICRVIPLSYGLARIFRLLLQRSIRVCRVHPPAPSDSRRASVDAQGNQMIAVVHCLAAGFSERLVRSVEEQHLGDLSHASSLSDAMGDGSTGRDLMEMAFLALMGRRPFEQSSIDVVMMERAWIVAREAGFDAARIRKAVLSSGESSCQGGLGSALRPVGHDMPSHSASGRSAGRGDRTVSTDSPTGSQAGSTDGTGRGRGRHRGHATDQPVTIRSRPACLAR